MLYFFRQVHTIELSNHGKIIFSNKGENIKILPCRILFLFLKKDFIITSGNFSVKQNIGTFCALAYDLVSVKLFCILPYCCAFQILVATIPLSASIKSMFYILPSSEMLWGLSSMPGLFHFPKSLPVSCNGILVISL